MMDFTPFLDRRLKMAWDERMGHGVFSTDHIRSGEYLEITPVIVIDHMPSDENLAKYVVAWAGKFAVPLGWTMLYNHSDKNCCEYSINIYDRLFAIVSVRDIVAGEQLTVNYGPNWFSSRGMEKINI